MDLQVQWDLCRLGSNSCVIRFIVWDVINQPNKLAHLRLWKNRIRWVLRNLDDLLESDSLRLLILTMYMDLWILFPICKWTYDVVWQIYKPGILPRLCKRKIQ